MKTVSWKRKGKKGKKDEAPPEEVDETPVPVSEPAAEEEELDLEHPV